MYSNIYVGLLVIFFLIFIILSYNSGHIIRENFDCHKCKSKDGNKLLPVTNPFFNLREITKNCILLEDHLFQKGKRCEDCIKKHMLTIEGLAEEAITLDKDSKCKEFYNLPDKIRELQREYINGEDPNEIGQKLRKLRKNLMQKCFEAF